MYLSLTLINVSLCHHMAVRQRLSSSSSFCSELELLYQNILCTQHKAIFAEEKQFPALYPTLKETLLVIAVEYATTLTLKHKQSS